MSDAAAVRRDLLARLRSNSRFICYSWAQRLFEQTLSLAEGLGHHRHKRQPTGIPFVRL